MVGRTAVLLAAGATLGLAVNVFHPRGVRLRSFAPPTACEQTAPGGRADRLPLSAVPAVEILSLTQVAKLCADPRALIVDARSAEEFAEGHVAGAIHLPCASSGGQARVALDQLSGKDILVVYGNHTSDAQPVAEELRSRSGRPDVRYAVLAGGFAAWNSGGFACSSGPCPDCQVEGTGR